MQEEVEVIASLKNDSSGLSLVPRGACRLCDGEERIEERRIGDFPIVRCTACGFLQTDRTLDGPALGAYYSRAFGHVGGRMFQGQQVNARVNSLLMRRFGLARRGLSFLDVGCGFGFLMQEMRDRFAMRTAGVEISDAERTFGCEELGLGIEASIDALGEVQYDTVGLFEVVEHIVDPVGFVRQVTRRLKPGGHLVIATDNFDCDVVRAMGNRFPKWIPHQHISLFNNRTLPRLIERVSGLEVTSRASFTPWELLVQKYIAKATNGGRGGRDFDLEAELESEGTRPFRLFVLRKLVNSLWFSSTLRRDLEGAMMVIVAGKPA